MLKCDPFRRAVLVASVVTSLVISPLARAGTTEAEQIRQLQDALLQSQKATEMLVKRIEQLEATVKSQSSQTVTTSAEDKAKIAELQEQVSQIAAGNSRNDSDGLPLHGFIDVGAAGGTRGTPKGFNIGKLDFYLTPQFSTRVKGLAELNFEVGKDGTVGTDLERLQLGYIVDDSLTLWMGRFHTPYGYWNTAFHHGAQIQTTIQRPAFLEFEDEGGVLPSHTVGAWATGSAHAGDGRITYDAYVGNAPRVDLSGNAPGSGTAGLDPNLAKTTSGNYMAGGNLGYQFGGTLEGLKLGVHGYGGNVSNNAVPQSKVETRMLGGYAVYIEDDWEVLSEYYRFSDRDKAAANGTQKSWAAYAQVGRTFGQYTPYVRYERARFDQADSYFSDLEGGQSYHMEMAGVRYDLDPKTALKVEYDIKSLTDRIADELHEFHFQYAVRF